MKYLLDTNILSEAVKKMPKSVLEKFGRHEYEIATAATVWHELRYGCQRLPFSRKRSLIESFLDDVRYGCSIHHYNSLIENKITNTT